MTLRSVNFRQQPFGFVDDQIPQRIMFAVGLMADQIRFPEVLGLDHNVTHASSSNNIRKLLFHLAKLIIVPPIDKTNPGQFIIDSPPRITQRKPSRTPTIGFKE